MLHSLEPIPKPHPGFSRLRPRDRLLRLVLFAVILLPAALAVMPAAASSSAGDDPSAGLAAPAGHLTAFDRYVLQGGWVTLWLLLPISVTALSLMLQATLQTRRDTAVPGAVIQQVCELLRRGEFAAAVEACAADPSPLAQTIYSGFLCASDGPVAVKRAMEQSLDERAVSLLRRLEYLNLLGHVAPMVGLFGTVQGIINMFGSISESGGIPIMSQISHDLGTALVATFWGLLIAIPSLSFFTILRGKVDVCVQQSMTAIDRVLLALKRKPAAAAPRPAKAPQLVG